MMYAIEQLEGDIDRSTFHPMIHLTKSMPEDYDVKNLSHPEMYDYFNDKTHSTEDNESALFVAKQDIFSHVVGLAGVEIVEENGEKLAHVTELVIGPRARGHELGKKLLETVVEWSTQHDADRVEIDVVPEKNGPGHRMLSSMDFMPSSEGKPVLDLTDSET